MSRISPSSEESELIELAEETRFKHEPAPPVRTYFEETIIYRPDQAHATLIKKRSCWYYCCALLCCRFGALLYDDESTTENEQPFEFFVPTQVYH